MEAQTSLGGVKHSSPERASVKNQTLGVGEAPCAQNSGAALPVIFSTARLNR